MSNALGIDEESLDFFLKNDLKFFKNKKEIDPANEKLYAYKKIYISKRGGGYREILKVESDELRNIQREIRRYLIKEYVPRECVHGFRKGKSPFTNAKQHLGKKYITVLDIKDFFPSISHSKVKDIFISLGCCNDIAENLSRLTTFQNSLPQGFYTSPIISNFALSKLDEKLEKYSIKNNITYTRYGDDLTFSSNIEKIDISPIREIIKQDGFSLNEKKTKNMNRGLNQVVTGLTVFDDKYPRIPKNIKKRLRLHMYYIKKYGSTNHLAINNVGVNKKKFAWGVDNIFGWIYYINAIEPNIYKKYLPIINNEKEYIKIIKEQMEEKMKFLAEDENL